VADGVTPGVHAVTILRTEPGAQLRLEATMAEDYRLLRRYPAFIGGQLVRCSEPETYLHITHWASEEALDAAVRDPEVRAVFDRLELASPLEPYRGHAVMTATGDGRARTAPEAPLPGVSLSPDELRVLVLEPIGPRADPSQGEPFESAREVSNDGRTAVGVWECTAGRFPVARDGTHSFMYILAGSATVRGSDGDTHELAPGAILVEPDGWTGEWDIRETIRKVYVMTRTDPC
jgi:uncharacterized protein